MSFMTVSHAYQLLESLGYIIARPQSGYYVAPQAIKMPKAPVIPVTRDEAVDINTYIFDMLQASRDPSVVPFASAFPDPRLFPLQQLNRSLAQVSKTATAMSVIENLPPETQNCVRLLLVAMPYRASPFLLMKLSLLPGR